MIVKAFKVYIFRDNNLKSERMKFHGIVYIKGNLTPTPKLMKEKDNIKGSDVIHQNWELVG